MLAHDFICTKEENIPVALNFFPEKKLLKAEMKHITVKDKWIREYYKLFNGLTLYNCSGRKINSLAYYGITLIPPESCLMLLKRIKHKGFMIRIRLNKLICILSYSLDNHLFIVHWGI